MIGIINKSFDRENSFPGREDTTERGSDKKGTILN